MNRKKKEAKAAFFRSGNRRKAFFRIEKKKDADSRSKELRCGYGYPCPHNRLFKQFWKEKKEDGQRKGFPVYNQIGAQILFRGVKISCSDPRDTDEQKSYDKNWKDAGYFLCNLLGRAEKSCGLIPENKEESHTEKAGRQRKGVGQPADGFGAFSVAFSVIQA